MVWSTEASNRAIYVGDLHTQQKKRIATAASMPVYAEPGYLLFHREGTLFAQPFEARKLELTGERFALPTKSSTVPKTVAQVLLRLKMGYSSISTVLAGHD